MKVASRAGTVVRLEVVTGATPRRAWRPAASSARLVVATWPATATARRRSSKGAITASCHLGECAGCPLRVGDIDPKGLEALEGR